MDKRNGKNDDGFFLIGSNHPLIKDKLTQIRDKHTKPAEFRKLVADIAVLLGYEATQDLYTKHVNIETPLCDCVGQRVADRVALVPVLRAGLGMLDGLLQILPESKVLHIGLYRDESSLQPVRYYCKLDQMNCDRDVALLIDPMLATAGTAIEAVNMLKEWGVKRIKFLCILAAQTGIERLSAAHPDVEIYACGVDPELNEHGYIVPGLGDCGDRQFY